MDITPIRKTIARIEAIDNGRFDAFIRSWKDSAGLDAKATTQIAGHLRDYIQVMPELMQLMATWVEKVGIREEIKPVLQAVESYIRRPDDEIDEQRNGLAGLLDDAYFLGRLLEQLAENGLPLPQDFKLSAFNSLTALILGEDVVRRLHQRLADAATKASQPKPPLPTTVIVESPPPAPPEPPPAQLDRRLIGIWYHSTFMSSGGFSYSNIRSQFFGSNGFYIEGSQSFVSSVQRSSAGDALSQMAFESAAPDSRGRWSTLGSMLTLEADDGYVYPFRMDFHQGTLMLSQPGREPKIWTRD